MRGGTGGGGDLGSASRVDPITVHILLVISTTPAPSSGASQGGAPDVQAQVSASPPLATPPAGPEGVQVMAGFEAPAVPIAGTVAIPTAPAAVTVVLEGRPGPIAAFASAPAGRPLPPNVPVAVPAAPSPPRSDDGPPSPDPVPAGGPAIEEGRPAAAAVAEAPRSAEIGFDALLPLGSDLIGEFIPLDRVALDESLSRFLRLLPDEELPAPTPGPSVPYPLVLVGSAAALEVTRRWRRHAGISGGAEEWKQGSLSLHGLS